MTEQEKRLAEAQKIILASMNEAAAALDNIRCARIDDRLELLNSYSEIMLRLSEAMKNVNA